jgi:hypothetical protein
MTDDAKALLAQARQALQDAAALIEEAATAEGGLTDRRLLERMQQDVQLQIKIIDQAAWRVSRLTRQKRKRPSASF